MFLTLSHLAGYQAKPVPPNGRLPMGHAGDETYSDKANALKHIFVDVFGRMGFSKREAV